MGEAKRRKMAGGDRQPDIPVEVLDRVSFALMRLANAASANFGADCYVHAALAQALLKRAGYDAKIVSGEAAWRVGNGGGDMIVHALTKDMVAQPKAFPYHTWLEHNHKIIDFTTYQFLEKAAQLDALDNQHTTVEWCPDYIYVDKLNSVSLFTATQGGTGLYHYRYDVVIHNKIEGAKHPLDEQDLAAAQFLYDNPQIKVHGPRNNM